MIEVDRLSKRYGQVTVVEGLSFTVPDGSITGFLGPNGAGKSTTMRCLLGLHKPTTGTVLIDGLPLTAQTRPAVLLQLGAGAKKAPFLLCDQRYVPVLSGRLEYPANNHCIRIRVTIGKHRALPLPQ